MSSRLALTPDQSSRLRKAFSQSLEEHEALAKNLAEQSPSQQEQARARLDETDARRFSEILTPKQRSIYRTQLGVEFDFSRLSDVGCIAPELRSADAWINTQPLTLREVGGKVVVVHFWAFGCINCIRNLPHYQGWQAEFATRGVTIIGIHTPETQRERQFDNLRRSVLERKIEYPALFDAASENWKAWGNRL